MLKAKGDAGLESPSLEKAGGVSDHRPGPRGKFHQKHLGSVVQRRMLRRQATAATAQLQARRLAD
jgi:hypothetical protein